MAEEQGVPSLADTLPGAPVVAKAAPEEPAKPAEAVVVQRKWVEDLDESLKGSKSLQKFSDENWKSSLAKSYVELEQKLGGSVAIPKADASPEEWDKYFSKVRPESPDKYNLGTVEGFEDKDFEAKFKADAHKAGLTDKQAAAVYSRFATLEVEAAKAMQARRSAYFAEQKSSLEKSWGAKYADNMKSASRAIQAFGGDLDIVGELKALGADNSAKMWQFLAKIGAEIGEDTLPENTPKSPKTEQSLAEMMYPTMKNKE